MFPEYIQVWIMSYGYAAIFLLLLFGIVGLPVPDETLLVLVGIMILKGLLHPVPAVISAFAGSACGISISFLLGRYGGTYVIRKYNARFHHSGNGVERVHAWFDRIGKWLLVAGYYIPGVRHLIAIVAGSSGLRPASFCVFAYSGALLWVATFISLGYFLGKEWFIWFGKIHFSALLILGIIGLVILIFLLSQWWRSRG